MEVVEPRAFVSGGMFREKDFREAIRAFGWSKFQGKPVLIQGCGDIPIPTWAYLVITAELAPFAKSISYGELKNPIPVFGKLGVSA